MSRKRQLWFPGQVGVGQDANGNCMAVSISDGAWDFPTLAGMFPRSFRPKKLTTLRARLGYESSEQHGYSLFKVQVSGKWTKPIRLNETFPPWEIGIDMKENPRGRRRGKYRHSTRQHKKFRGRGTAALGWGVFTAGKPDKRQTRRGKRMVARIARGNKVTVRRGKGSGRAFLPNPMSKKNYEFMAGWIRDVRNMGMPEKVVATLIEFAVDVIRHDGNPRFDSDRFIAATFGGTKKNPRRFKRNPLLAVVGANPRGLYIGRALRLFYNRDHGKHPGKYQHPFASQARIFAMPNGSLVISNKGA